MVQPIRLDQRALKQHAVSLWLRRSPAVQPIRLDQRALKQRLHRCLTRLLSVGSTNTARSESTETERSTADHASQRGSTNTARSESTETVFNSASHRCHRVQPIRLDQRALKLFGYMRACAELGSTNTARSESTETQRLRDARFNDAVQPIRLDQRALKQACPASHPSIEQRSTNTARSESTETCALVAVRIDCTRRFNQYGSIREH